MFSIYESIKRGSYRKQGNLRKTEVDSLIKGLVLKK